MRCHFDKKNRLPHSYLTLWTHPNHSHSRTSIRLQSNDVTSSRTVILQKYCAISDLPAAALCGNLFFFHRRVIRDFPPTGRHDFVKNARPGGAVFPKFPPVSRSPVLAEVRGATTGKDDPLQELLERPFRPRARVGPHVGKEDPFVIGIFQLLAHAFTSCFHCRIKRGCPESELG